MRDFSHNSNDGGATLVEFAIIVPLLLLLLFGIIESARLVTEFTTIRTAAREGARFATTVDDAAGVPNYRNCAGIVEAAGAKAVVGNLESVTVQWDSPNGYSFSCTDTGLANPNGDEIIAGTTISVSVESTFNPVVPLLQPFFSDIALDSRQSRQVFVGVVGDE